MSTMFPWMKQEEDDNNGVTKENFEIENGVVSPASDYIPGQGGDESMQNAIENFKNENNLNPNNPENDEDYIQAKKRMEESAAEKEAQRSQRVNCLTHMSIWAASSCFHLFKYKYESISLSAQSCYHSTSTYLVTDCRQMGHLPL